ncbi:MAG: signal recognition particle protein [Chthoniobacterales bacterium]|nr:signal recognition particle protein [Chthoniobacterales bacterium]
MFSSLSNQLQKTFKNLRGHGSITEANINEALREVRLALLDADVHFQVAKDFIARVKEKALGQAVLQSVTPGQQIIKIFHDELTALLGGDAAPLNLSSPGRVLMVGLNGAGKTTSSAKLAKWLQNQGQRPLLVALDLVRPAAIDQLVALGRQINVPVFQPKPGTTDVIATAREAIAWCQEQQGTIAIYDTAGRREIDEALVKELVQLKELLQPQEILLICDGATGQQAVSVAEKFHTALALTGLVVTKLDGDARGGASLSLRTVTGCPIKFSGVGEKIDQWEPFHPDRLAGRILGMGDIVSFVEKAAEAVEMDEMERLEKKLKSASLDLEDFLNQLKMIRRMGPLENLLGMLPGAANLPSNAVDGKDLQRIEAIILSMTLQERKRPEILNARRRQRIARGSGTSVTEVNNLLQRFQQMKKMMKNMGKMKKMLSGFANGGFSGLKQYLPN